MATDASTKCGVCRLTIYDAVLIPQCGHSLCATCVPSLSFAPHSRMKQCCICSTSFLPSNLIPNWSLRHALNTQAQAERQTNGGVGAGSSQLDSGENITGGEGGGGSGSADLDIDPEDGMININLGYSGGDAGDTGEGLARYDSSSGQSSGSTQDTEGSHHKPNASIGRDTTLPEWAQYDLDDEVKQDEPSLSGSHASVSPGVVEGDVEIWGQVKSDNGHGDPSDHKITQGGEGGNGGGSGSDDIDENEGDDQGPSSQDIGTNHDDAQGFASSSSASQSRLGASISSLFQWKPVSSRPPIFSGPKALLHPKAYSDQAVRNMKKQFQVHANRHSSPTTQGDDMSKGNPTSGATNRPGSDTQQREMGTTEGSTPTGDLGRRGLGLMKSESAPSRPGIAAWKLGVPSILTNPLVAEYLATGKPITPTISDSYKEGEGNSDPGAGRSEGGDTRGIIGPRRDSLPTSTDGRRDNKSRRPGTGTDPFPPPPPPSTAPSSSSSLSSSPSSASATSSGKEGDRRVDIDDDPEAQYQARINASLDSELRRLDNRPLYDLAPIPDVSAHLAEQAEIRKRVRARLNMVPSAAVSSAASSNASDVPSFDNDSISPSIHSSSSTSTSGQGGEDDMDIGSFLKQMRRTMADGSRVAKGLKPFNQELADIASSSTTASNTTSNIGQSTTTSQQPDKVVMGKGIGVAFNRQKRLVPPATSSSTTPTSPESGLAKASHSVSGSGLTSSSSPPLFTAGNRKSRQPVIPKTYDGIQPGDNSINHRRGSSSSSSSNSSSSSSGVADSIYSKKPSGNPSTMTTSPTMATSPEARSVSQGALHHRAPIAGRRASLQNLPHSPIGVVSRPPASSLSISGSGTANDTVGKVASKVRVNGPRVSGSGGGNGNQVSRPSSRGAEGLSGEIKGVSATELSKGVKKRLGDEPIRAALSSENHILTGTY